MPLTWLSARIIPYLPFILLLLLTIFCFLWLGGDRPFATPDEARYVEIPREMVETGDWLTPRLNGVKYFEKPPLMYWMHAILISCFGTTEWIMRLVPAFFGWVGVISTYCFAKNLFNRQIGLWAAAILATSVLYMGLSRLIILDMPISVLITIAMMCFYQAIKTRKRIWFYAMTVAFAGGVMTKGLMAIAVPLPIMGFWMILQRIPLRPFYPFSCLALFLLFAAPWHILVCLKNPDFFHKYFIIEHVLRYTTMLHKRYQPFWFFIPVLLVGMLPWSLVAVRSLKWKGPSLFLSLWIVWVFIFFSFSKSKLIPYVLPLFPPFAILIAVKVERMRKIKWVMLGMGVFLAFFVNLIAPSVQKKSIKPFVEIIQKDRKPGEKIACFQAYYQDLPVYLKQKVMIIDYLGELEFGVMAEDTQEWIVPSCKNLHKVWIVARKDRWKKSGEKGRIVAEILNACCPVERDDSEFYVLVYKD